MTTSTVMSPDSVFYPRHALSAPASSPAYGCLTVPGWPGNDAYGPGAALTSPSRQPAQAKPEAPSKGAKRKRKPVSPTPARRQQHNEAEQRRRVRVNELRMQLSRECGQPTRGSLGSTLQFAIDHIKSLHKQYGVQGVCIESEAESDQLRPTRRQPCSAVKVDGRRSADSSADDSSSAVSYSDDDSSSAGSAPRPVPPKRQEATWPSVPNHMFYSHVPPLAAPAPSSTSRLDATQIVHDGGAVVNSMDRDDYSHTSNFEGHTAPRDGRFPANASGAGSLWPRELSRDGRYPAGI